MVSLVHVIAHQARDAATRLVGNRRQHGGALRFRQAGIQFHELLLPFGGELHVIDGVRRFAGEIEPLGHLAQRPVVAILRPLILCEPLRAKSLLGLGVERGLGLLLGAGADLQRVLVG